MGELVNTLQDMGLSMNEAKAYQALLRHGPANGYEISKRSGITRSVIYGVLDRLADKGYALAVDSDPVITLLFPQLSSSRDTVRRMSRTLNGSSPGSGMSPRGWTLRTTFWGLRDTTTPCARLAS